MPSTLSSLTLPLSFCYSSSTGCALLIIVPNQLPQSLFLHKIQLHFFLPSLIPSEIAAWCRATSNAIRERIDQTFLPLAKRVGAWSTLCLKNATYRGRQKSASQVWWILLLLLLTTSASTCLEHSRNLGSTLLATPVRIAEKIKCLFPDPCRVSNQREYGGELKCSF